MSITITNFERCCRLCAEEQEVTIMLFSEEAEAMLLKKKLNKYLLIEVEEDDKLPKNICIKCCSKLQTVCEFIDKALQAQEILQNYSLALNQPEEPVKVIKVIKQEYDSDDEVKFATMEISVDPMVVLQNSEDTQEESSNPNTAENSESEDQDVTHLHSVDGEDVTIKLIKKGDKTEDLAEQSESIIKPFPCLTCHRGFHTELALRSHLWTHKPETTPTSSNPNTFKCTICREQFDSKIQFLEHLKIHNTPGMCKLCGRRFRTEANLEAHLETHKSTTGKSYPCKVCGRSYNTSSNLKTHSVTHSNERPYQCQYCRKCFKRNQDLKFHINQHTGAKPYKCPFCDKRFASSGNCYSHKSRMHPGRRSESIVRTRDGNGKMIEAMREAKSRKIEALRERKIKPDIATRSGQAMQFRAIAPRPVYNAKGPLKYQCTLCEHSFLKRDNFTYHMYQHTGEKPFNCSYCSEKFVTRRGLAIHHDRSHPSIDRPLALLTRNVLLK
ncbi:zinc finger protein 470 [Bicyclus anynana]|uniref:Zinc finger protein 470 n=1 Tax=Bicyclus anynana TaxID=110368 RepID=A0A6J1MMP4_BICAN|nr:zinc finger protein 470 [Bicyclus anynana]